MDRGAWWLQSMWSQSRTRLSTARHAVLKSKKVKVTSDWSHISLVVEKRSFRVKQNQFKGNFKSHIFTQK